jgi:4-hydroxybenzoate polyprenyltransferase
MAVDAGVEKSVLCVDLDRTLINSDLLWESMARFIVRRPFGLLALVRMAMRGTAYLKGRLAEFVEIDVGQLSYKAPIVELVRSIRAEGTPTVLVTGASETHARRIAEHLQLFDAVFATSETTGNLTGAAKARLLVDRYGERGFAYIGDSIRDLAVWRHASRAIAVDAGLSVRGRLASLGVEYGHVRTRRVSLLPWARQLRVHQWIKNILVFIPMLAVAKDRDLAHFSASVLAFAAFCLLTGAIYIINDLSDLDADRAHPTKRFRPLAAGEIAIPHALMGAVLLACVAFTLASLVNLLTVAVLVVYLVMTTAYTVYFKRVLVADVLMLAGLYAVRVLAGCAAILARPSVWLLLFCVFAFFSLALMKRCAELIGLDDVSRNGRGYRSEDKSILLMLGTTAGMASVLVFGLYVYHQSESAQYQAPELLWAVVPLLLFWMSRAWLLTNRGGMHMDPVVFALKDRASCVVAVLIAIIMIAAAVIRL